MAQENTIRYRLAFLIDDGTVEYGIWVEDVEMLFPWIADDSIPRWIEDQYGEYVAGYIGEIDWSNDLFEFEQQDADLQIPVNDPAQEPVEGDQPEMIG